MIRKIFYLLIIVTAINQQAIAQSKEEIKVQAAVETLRSAMVNADSIQLEEILSDKLSYGHSSGKVETKNELIHSLASGESDFVTIELSAQTITLFDETAIVRHIFSAALNDNGKATSVKLSILLVWHKEKHTWKLIARQAVRL